MENQIQQPINQMPMPALERKKARWYWWVLYVLSFPGLYLIGGFFQNLIPWGQVYRPYFELFISLALTASLYIFIGYLLYRNKVIAKIFCLLGLPVALFVLVMLGAFGAL